jgi:ABC-2 type transport system permease protein
MSSTILQIAGKELVTVYRNRVVVVNAIIILLLLLVAAYGGYKNYHTVKNSRELAQQEKRQQWLHQDPKHPHFAAHFGTFVYKPKTWLSMMDAGLDNYTGAYAYLEPHRQNDFVFKPAEEDGGAIRFGQLSVALVLQLLVPLLIIFMGFASMTQERDQGTLPLLYSTGVQLHKIALGKVLGQFTALVVILLPALLLCAGFFYVQAPVGGGTWWQRLVLLMGLYGVYFLIFTLLTVYVSTLSRHPGNALLILLCSWILCCIVLPKAAANIGSNRHPLPTQYALREAIQQDIAHGINGHDSKGARAKALEEKLLRQYHVSQVSQLPFNFEGYIMQAGEEYSSLVYDKYFHQLQQTLIDQDKYSRYTGLVDPYLAVQGLSMGLAATDIYTHIDFQQDTEAYRRKFVQQMNEDMKNNSKLGDWNYKSTRALYASVPDFRYTPMPLRTVLSLYWMELAGLFTVLFILLLLFFTQLKHIPIIKSI